MSYFPGFPTTNYFGSTSSRPGRAVDATHSNTTHTNTYKLTCVEGQITNILARNVEVLSVLKSDSIVSNTKIVVIGGDTPNDVGELTANSLTLTAVQPTNPPPVPESCNVGRLYYELVAGAQPNIGPYTQIAPVIQVCESGVSTFIGNVMSESPAPFPAVDNVIVTTSATSNAPHAVRANPSTFTLENNTFRNAFGPIIIESGSDDISFSVPPTKTVHVLGNLNVVGTTASLQYEVINIADNILFLNKGYTSTVLHPAGLVMNVGAVNPLVQMEVSIDGFVARDIMTINPPYVNVTADPTGVFVPGDIIQISDTPSAKNDGLYEVLSVDGVLNRVFLAWDEAQSARFVQRQVITVDYSVTGDPAPYGTLTHVNVVYVGTNNLNTISLDHLRGSNSNSMTHVPLTRISALVDDVQLVNNGDGSYSVNVGKTTEAGPGSIVFAGKSDYSFSFGGSDVHTTVVGADSGSGSTALNVNNFTGTTSVGYNAGRQPSGSYATALGYNAGSTAQGGGSVAVGYQAGRYGQNDNAVAIGSGAAAGASDGSTPQPSGSIAIGLNCPTPGAVNRLAIQAESPVDATYLTPQPFNKLLQLEWNGTLYRLPVLPTNASTLQGTLLSSVNDDVQITPVAGGYTIDVGSAASGSNTVKLTGGFGDNLNGFESVAIGYRAAELNQNPYAIAIGSFAGNTGQQPYGVAVGASAGRTSQAGNCVAIGRAAGQTTQGVRGSFGSSVAIGVNAGNNDQAHLSVAVGPDAGFSLQNAQCVAVGRQSGYGAQGFLAIAIGNEAGRNDQGAKAVAVGQIAGQTTQGTSSVAIGDSTGQTLQASGAVAIGAVAGQTNQGNNAIAMGVSAGQTLQSTDSIAIGDLAGQTNQGVLGGVGGSAVAIGANAGQINQATLAVALGRAAGETSQGQSAVSIGNEAGRYNQVANAIAIGTQAAQGVNSSIKQGLNAIAIGSQAGRYGQGDNAIALGFQASTGVFAGTLQQPAGSIAIGYQCETPGAANRLAFKAEDPITPSNSTMLAHSALLNLQWNGTLYRVPVLPSNATDVQKTNLTAGTGISVTGTYPNFTVTNTSLNDSVTLSSAGGTVSLVNDGTGPLLAVKGITAGSSISITDSGTSLTVNNSAPDQIVNLSAGTGIGVTGTYPNFTITNTSLTNSLTLTPINNDVQIVTVTGGYTIDIGSAPGRGVVKLTNGSGDNLNASNSVAIGSDSGTVNQGITGGTDGGAVAIGVSSGRNSQGQKAIAIGRQAAFDSQGVDAVAIGAAAAYTTQNNFAVAIGVNAGNFVQGSQSVAIGNSAGRVAQGGNCVSIGVEAGRYSQDSGAVAIGHQAGLGNPAGPLLRQGQNAVAIGSLAGRYGQDAGAIAIGNQAAQGNIGGTLVQPARSIAIGNLCETPGAVDRLAFKAETVVTPDATNQQALSALLPLQWNGTLYRIPALASNASDLQTVTLTSAGGTTSLVNDGTGPTLAVKGITAGSNITISDSGTALTINSTGTVVGVSIYAFIQMVNNVFTGHGYSFTGSPVFSEMTSATATYFSSLSPEFTIVSNAKLRYTGATTRQFKVGSYFFATTGDGFAIGVAVNDVLNTNTLSFWKSTDTAQLDVVITLSSNDTISIHSTRQSGTSVKEITAFAISIVSLN